MQDVILMMDVGGTHTRARLALAGQDPLQDRGLVSEHSAPLADKSALLEFIRSLLAAQDSRVSAAVLSCAGPVQADAVTMTNWRGRDTISRGDLVPLGLPAARTLIINDMEAAALCLIACKTGRVSLATETLHAPAGGQRAHFNNAVLIIPGTGVGIAGVMFPDGPGAHPFHVSCELQHTAAAGLDAAHAGLLEAVAHGLGKPWASWEDLVSGQGLVRIHEYTASGAAAQPYRTGGLDPGTIAARAVAGTDQACVRALDAYYHVAGALAQVVALAFQPFAGIYLGGETTAKNLQFIRASSFVSRLQENNLRHELLKSFPVYLVPGYMNLLGTQYLAGRRFM